jgi:hypothetical protein
LTPDTHQPSGGRGRPPTTGAVRTKVVPFRLTGDEHRELARLATRAGMNISDYLRSIVFAAPPPSAAFRGRRIVPRRPR